MAGAHRGAARPARRAISPAHPRARDPQARPASSSRRRGGGHRGDLPGRHAARRQAGGRDAGCAARRARRPRARAGRPPRGAPPLRKGARSPRRRHDRPALPRSGLRLHPHRRRRGGVLPPQCAPRARLRLVAARLPRRARDRAGRARPAGESRLSGGRAPGDVITRARRGHSTRFRRSGGALPEPEPLRARSNGRRFATHRGMDSELPFPNRRAAGRLLAERLQRYRGAARTVVLGLPLGVIIARKLGAPGNPELAIGAIAEGGAPYFNEEVLGWVGADDAYLAREVERQRAEIVRRQRRFRHGRPLALPEGGTVILVDDGIATGSTVIAAIQALRERGVRRLVCAIPVAPPDTAELLRGLADELVVLATPSPFGAVGAFYQDFHQVSDAEVVELLRRAGAHELGKADGPAGA